MQDKYLQYIESIARGGTRQRISRSQLGNVKIALPNTLKAQQKIASFLDKKTTAINSIIEKKEKLIEKLKAYKKSVITEAVTKGKLGEKYIDKEGELVDEIEMKDSGVEWLGKIPKYYRQVKLKRISNVQLGKMLQNKKKPNYLHKNYLKAKNVFWNRLDLSEIEKMWFSRHEIKKYRLKEDDLLICEGGEVGRAAIWKDEIDECYIQNSIHRVRFLKNQNPKFYLYYFIFLGEIDYFNSIVNQVSIGHLTKEKLVDVLVIESNLKIQNAIVDYLDKITKQTNKIIKKTQQSIQKYKAYKKSLIYEAVTGKIDLRDYNILKRG